MNIIRELKNKGTPPRTFEVLSVCLSFFSIAVSILAIYYIGLILTPAALVLAAVGVVFAVIAHKRRGDGLDIAILAFSFLAVIVSAAMLIVAVIAFLGL